MATGTSHQEYLQTRFFGSLDGVRTLAILAVVWHHVPHPPDSPRIASLGFLGVDMFFVLSGFLIVTLLLREADRRGRIHLRAFYMRRCLRIFPIYYLLLLAVLLAYLILRPDSDNARNYYSALPYFLTYTCNWVPITVANMGILWSLATEEQFYLVWPTVEKYLRPRMVLLVLATVIFVSQLVNFGFLDPLFEWIYGGPVVLHLLDATFTPIALGVLLAHVLHHPGGYECACRLVGHRWSPIVLLLLLTLVCAVAPEDISGLPRLVIQVLMMLLLGSLVVRADHAARGLLELAAVRRVGVVSYGMYLYHMWVIDVVRRLFQLADLVSIWGFFVAAVLASVLVADVSYRLIETPFLRLKDRFAA